MLHISFGIKFGKQFTSYYFWLVEHPCEPFTLSILSVLFSLFGENQTRDYDIEHNDYALCSMFPAITLEKSMLVGSFAFYDS
jgi:hypothetical protein